VRGFTEGKLYCLFGCGGDRDATKRSLMGQAAGELADHCIITSDNPRSESPDDIIRQIVPGVEAANCPYEVIPDRRKAIYRAVAKLSPGDALVIAGKGHENYQEVGGQTFPFDDMEVAGEALNMGDKNAN